MWVWQKCNFSWSRENFTELCCTKVLSRNGGTWKLILQNFLRLLILERITFQDFPSREILRRIIITTSADSNSSPTQKIFPGGDIHLFARIFTPAPVTACGQKGVTQIPMQGVTNPALGPLVHQEIHSAIPTRRNMVVTSETLRIKVKKIRMTNIMSQLGKAIL